MSLTNSPNSHSPYQAPLSNRIACERCRQHKLRCTRQSSSSSNVTCTRCSRVGAACITKSRGRVGRPKTNRTVTSEQQHARRTEALEDSGAMTEASLNMLLTAVSSSQPTPGIAGTESSHRGSVGDLYPVTVPTSVSSVDECTGAEFHEDTLEQSLLENALSSPNTRQPPDFSDINFFAHHATQSAQSPCFGFQSYAHDPNASALPDPLGSPHEGIITDHSLWMRFSSLSRDLHRTCRLMGKKHCTASEQTFGAVLEDNETSEALRNTQDFCNLLRELMTSSKLSENGFKGDHLTTPDPVLIVQISQCYIYLLRIHSMLISRLLNENAPPSAGMDGLCHVMEFQIGGFNLESVPVKVNVFLEIILQLVGTMEASLGIPKGFCIREEPQTNTESILDLFPSDAGFVEICMSVLQAEERVQHSVGGGGVRRLKDLMKRAKKKYSQLIF